LAVTEKRAASPLRAGRSASGDQTAAATSLRPPLATVAFSDHAFERGFAFVSEPAHDIAGDVDRARVAARVNTAIKGAHVDAAEKFTSGFAVPQQARAGWLLIA